MLRYVLAAGAAVALATPAAADTFDATRVQIVHAAAQLQVIPEDRSDISVELAQIGRFPAPRYSVAEGRLVIDGGLRHRIRGCSSGIGGTQGARVGGIGFTPTAQLPVITLRTPRNVDVSIGGAVHTQVGGAQSAKLDFEGCGASHVGAMRGDLTVSNDGSGNVEAAAAGGAVTASLDGSGNVRLAGAGQGARLSLDGSGNLTLGAIEGSLSAGLDGSGNLQVAGGAARADLSLDGSGNMRIGAVHGDLSAQLDGSGNMQIDALEGGAATIGLDGSGDINVRGGRADRLALRIDGSGNIRFAGAAGVLDAQIDGSGNAIVASAGQVASMRSGGSGRVRIGQ